MSDIAIRLARISERGLLEALQRRASLSNSADRDALLTNPDSINLPLQQISDGRVFVAERNGAIAGFSVAIPREDGDFELDGLFVDPDCWRQGVGRQLVGHGASVATSAGARYLHVVGNPHAEHFYRACGFEVIGTQRTLFGIGLLMKMPCRGEPGTVRGDN